MDPRAGLSETERRKLKAEDTCDPLVCFGPRLEKAVDGLILVWE